MPLQDLQPQLLALSPPEKHQAIEILLQSLDERCRLERTVLTLNRRDFVKLHRQNPNHDRLRLHHAFSSCGGQLPPG
jgi:hypothetical protein